MEGLVNLAGGIVKGLLFKGIAMGVNHRGENFPVDFVVFMPSEKAAKLASGILNLGKGLSSIMPQDQVSSQDRRFLNMEVSCSGQVLK
ncbi:hypothetical protein J7K97_00580 [Candidatus Aerophobetes bacterium]|nr:hypothetical protein [Candidatus Aerophobetes bacterium]